MLTDSFLLNLKMRLLTVLINIIYYLDLNLTLKRGCMSILDWLNKREKTTPTKDRLDLPGDLWVKCFGCNDVLYLKDLEANAKVCPCKKAYHFRISPKERIGFIFDKNSFEECDADIHSVDYLEFEDTEHYKDRLDKAKKKTKQSDAVVIGMAKLKHRSVNVAVMDFSFMGGSMGSVVGEKIARVIEKACDNRFPLIIFVSSGGARMQEGIMSLMQMAKTSAVLGKLNERKVPYISVLCDPTTGGTAASFAMLGDIILAEPGALISFAGPRVIEQTIRQKLPKGFQRSEFLLEHGMIDRVVDRNELRDTLSELIVSLDPHFKVKKKPGRKSRS